MGYALVPDSWLLKDGFVLGRSRLGDHLDHFALAAEE